jgi:UDP-N-acetylmuramate--alanine ligase
MNLNEIKFAYFLGIGGIGMSAIARYLNSNGIKVAGYDKTPTDLTSELINEGIEITFEDSAATIPGFVHAFEKETLLVYTPAIPKNHLQFLTLAAAGRKFYKRSEVLGLISNDSFCIAVAGTHGKTTTSTLISHLLYDANVNFTAFLGGISANYNTNYIHKTDGHNLFPDKPVVVLEADEFDRSFHRLSPDIAVITAMDPDHLDIYGTEEVFYEAFEIFASKIKSGGQLILHANLFKNRQWPTNANILLYENEVGRGLNANFSSTVTEIKNGNFYFDYTAATDPQNSVITKNLYCGLPGFHNVENATAALGVCLNLLQLDQNHLRAGLESFRGAKRRFEYIVKTQEYIVIDDYAHHPEELNAIIGSVMKLYPDKKVTGIFQPHLFTRTRDFADGFAESLSALHRVILMDIYPAREEAIPGITSSWLLDKIDNPNKSLQTPDEIINEFQKEKPEVLLIMGAGDIDRLVPKIKEIYA